MGLFGKSFEEKVDEAVAQVRAKVPGLRDLSAQVEGKVVTLTGVASSPDAKAQAMQEFNALVATDNTINSIRVDRPAAAPAPQPQAPVMAEAPLPGMAGVTPAAAVTGPAERWHEVSKGDTLSALAKKYYGNANLYTKIFEANRDQLKDPNLIKVGQKLRIPEVETKPPKMA